MTLLELMVTLTVATVLLSVAVPSFRQFVASQRMRTASYELVSHLLLARSEAVKRSAPVELRPSASGWGGGWMVVAAGVAEPLARHGGLPGVVVTEAPDNVVFDFNGRVANADAVVRIGLADGVSGGRCISLDPAGRPRANARECR